VKQEITVRSFSQGPSGGFNSLHDNATFGVKELSIKKGNIGHAGALTCKILQYKYLLYNMTASGE
jgi:hypothetical protein